MPSLLFYMLAPFWTASHDQFRQRSRNPGMHLTADVPILWA